MILSGVFFLITLSSSALEVQDDQVDYDLIIYENSNEVLFDEAPEFITKNLTLFVDLGGSITLPCQLKHEEHFTRIWTRKNDKISLGNSVLSEVYCHSDR